MRYELEVLYHRCGMLGGGGAVYEGGEGGSAISYFLGGRNWDGRGLGMGYEGVQFELVAVENCGGWRESHLEVVT